MKFAKQLYRYLSKLNLWLHAVLGLSALVLLFAAPIFPFSNGPVIAFRWVYSLGFLLIFGIGDGYPPLGMKILGSCVLGLLALAILCTLVLNFCLFGRLLFERTKSWLVRSFLFGGVVSLLALSFFVASKPNYEEIASDAILAEDIKSYERAALQRHNNDINADLWWAARCGRLRMVEYLISKGADPNAKPRGGDSVLSGALPNVLERPDGNKPVIEYLKSHGATN